MPSLHNILSKLTDIPGWRTKRHIIAIESDDWGSIRMPSKEAYNNLLKSGIRVNECNYCSNDSIATTDDLELLFEVLNSVKDKNGNPAVITANALVANPDFDKIKQSGYTEYNNILITDGIPKIKGCEHSLDLWKEGNTKGFFRIQSHGREHLNVLRWMHCLQNDYPETKIAFDNGVYGISTTITSEKRTSFLPALDYRTTEELDYCCTAVTQGLQLFEDIFGFKSKSFIAPNYLWGLDIEKSLAKNSVQFIQGNKFNHYRSTGNFEQKSRLRFTGSRTKDGMINLSRNADFEPSQFVSKDWVSNCIKQIDEAFLMHHPAIISSHRVNYIGSLNPSNRDNGLKMLKNLLDEVVRRWPDVEFMSSDSLGMVIKGDKYGNN